MNLERVKAYRFAPVEHRLTWRDTIIYGLSLGYGFDPIDPRHLRFVYEKQLGTLPSMACILGYPGFWLQEPQLEVDWIRLLHGEHYYEVFHPLPAEGVITARHKVVGVEDKGADRGAVVRFEKALTDRGGNLLARVEQANFLRGDGGCGSFGRTGKERGAVPDGTPDVIHELATSRQIALLYRLNGDYNPVHADPEVAREAGFPEPWIAGMCSMGLATRAVIEALCEHEPSRVRSMFVRFRNVCFPGETMRYEFYRSGTGARFRVVAKEREAVILDRGEVVFD
jgi:acyl dehydratase